MHFVCGVCIFFCVFFLCLFCLNIDMFLFGRSVYVVAFYLKARGDLYLGRRQYR